MQWPILSLFLILSFHQAQPFIISAISAIYSIYQIINDAHDTYSKLTTPSTADLMDEIVNIKNSVNQVTKEVSKKIDALYDQLIEQLPRLGQINRGMESFSTRFNRISFLYKHFERLIRKKKPSPRQLKEFSTVALSFFSDSVSATLDALHELFIPTEIGHLNDGLLALLAKNLEGQSSDNGNPVCSPGTPPEEQLWLLYTALITAELRGFMMQTFTYVLLESYSGESYSTEIVDSRSGTLVRIQEYQFQIANLIEWSGRTFYDCDASGYYEKWIEYGELDLFQSFYIVNQYSLLRDCGDYCEALSGISKGSVDCAEDDAICPKVEPCHGRIIECRRFEKTGAVCINRNFYVASRRYLYYWDGAARGYESNCSKSNKIEVRTFKGKNAEGRVFNCDYCGCLCVQDKFSSKHVHAVSFRPQIADIQNNKVLSGIRFHLWTPQLLQLQIQQGEIQTDSIGVNTVEWKPLETMQLDKNKVWDENDPTPTFYDDNNNKYQAEVDFGQLTWENRDIYFDDLIAPDGYVVTGARLNRASNDDKAIQLEIHVTPYDFGAAKLIISDDQPSIWIKPLHMRAVNAAYMFELRNKIGKSGGKGPMKQNRRTRMVSKPYTWISLQLSNSEDDARGTVYPLVDLRNVTMSNPFLLEGVGLIYREPVDDNEIGYLAFSLRAMNRKKFLQLEITSDDLELDDNSMDALAPPKQNEDKNEE